MKELRKLSMEKIRRMCIDNDFYTDGDCYEYDRMLTYANNVKRATTKEIEKIATDIKEHSDGDYQVIDIMFKLINECCITYNDF